MYQLGAIEHIHMRPHAVQASAGLPQTGIADDDTWQALLGPHAEPSDIDTLFSDNENDQDMCGNNKGVWLLGEQRWSRVGY